MDDTGEAGPVVRQASPTSDHGSTHHKMDVSNGIVLKPVWFSSVRTQPGSGNHTEPREGDLPRAPEPLELTASLLGAGSNGFEVSKAHTFLT